MPFLPTLLLPLLFPGVLLAAEPDLPSIQAARIAARAASQAAGRSDIPAATRAWREALLHRPDTPAYLLPLAAAETAAGNLADACAALDRLADLGLTADLSAGEWDPLRPHPAFPPVAARLHANAAPAGPPGRLLASSSSSFLGESFAWHPGRAA